MLNLQEIFSFVATSALTNFFYDLTKIVLFFCATHFKRSDRVFDSKIIFFSSSPSFKFSFLLILQCRPSTVEKRSNTTRTERKNEKREKPFYCYCIKTQATVWSIHCSNFNEKTVSLHKCQVPKKTSKRERASYEKPVLNLRSNIFKCLVNEYQKKNWTTKVWYRYSEYGFILFLPKSISIFQMLWNEKLV